MFEDVKELYLGAALTLQTRLREAAAAVVWPQYGSSYPSRPPQAHISPSWSSQANSSESSPSHAPSHGTSATDSHSDPTTAWSATAIYQLACTSLWSIFNPTVFWNWCCSICCMHKGRLIRRGYGSLFCRSHHSGSDTLVL